MEIEQHNCKIEEHKNCKIEEHKNCENQKDKKKLPKSKKRGNQQRHSIFSEPSGNGGGHFSPALLTYSQTYPFQGGGGTPRLSESVVWNQEGSSSGRCSQCAEKEGNGLRGKKGMGTVHLFFDSCEIIWYSKRIDFSNLLFTSGTQSHSFIKY